MAHKEKAWNILGISFSVRLVFFLVPNYVMYIQTCKHEIDKTKIHCEIVDAKKINIDFHTDRIV